MSNHDLRFLAPPLTSPVSDRATRPIGRELVEGDAIRPEHLMRALQLQTRLDAPIGEILVSEGWAEVDDIQSALARQHGVRLADLKMQSPDPSLGERMPCQFWLHHRVIPWMRLGRTTLIATANPDQFEQVRIALSDTFNDILPVLANETQIDSAIADAFARPLAEAAETRVAGRLSCRTLQFSNRVLLPLLLIAGLAALVAAPVAVISVLSFIAIGTLFMFSALKATAFATYLLQNHHRGNLSNDAVPRPDQNRLPKVSVLVPLFHEKEIAGALIERLSRLTYPKALLDVILVLEEHDDITRRTLAKTTLPKWIRVIRAPSHGQVTTKPRAMNYALDFCRGEIIGVWDAEDAPAKNQIEQVVSHFSNAPEDVVCLQGILDYYNPRTNWLSRCFTIEYASWFRVVLPGIARLGLVVPLGGTTLFFKRDKLEELGGWDAHNVTEDADLGVRLCRAGYRTQMINTVTYEEANCRVWPWIKQRSRWLKGFMVTYLVHMRDPFRLLSQLGAWRFLSLQAFFVGTLCQFLLAPVLWSFWLILFGFGHPVQSVVPSTVIYSLAGVLLGTELLAVSIGMVAVSAPERRFLMRWVPTMMFYFPLAVVAAYKALAELAIKPYYWDKTQHGHAGAEISAD